MTYTFKVYYKDNTIKDYESTSYQTLYEYFLYTPRLDKSIDDIDHIELVRRYEYYSCSKGCKCATYINETLYNKLANEYLLDQDKWVRRSIKSVDDYIRTVLSFNM